MADKYIKSNDISVYPCGNRDNLVGKLSKLNIEQNIVKPHNTITDINSYVLSGLNLSMSHISDTDSYTFNISPGKGVINGYYFELSEITQFTHILTELDNTQRFTIFLKCELESNNIVIDSSQQTIEEIKVDDTDLEFKGITINDELGTEYTGSNLELKLGYFYNAGEQDNLDIVLVSEPIKSQFITNSMRFDLSDLSLSLDNISESFEDYLNNDFILDDGEI